MPSNGKKKSLPKLGKAEGLWSGSAQGEGLGSFPRATQDAFDGLTEGGSKYLARRNAHWAKMAKDDPEALTRREGKYRTRNLARKK